MVVDNGKVQAVLDGFVGTDRYPGAKVIDLRQRFVLPGLIDSHVHLISDRAGADGTLAVVSTCAAAAAYEAQMNAGTLALRDAISMGWVNGPRIIDAGRATSTTSGHMDGRLGYAEWVQEGVHTDNLCDSPESCRRAVRMQVGRGVDVIKIATVNAADLLGVSKLAGSLEPGKSADIIAVGGDPLKDVKVLKQVPFVMASGKVFKHEQ
ncbi:amidohydrolase family protein [Pseudoduganella sp. UC29_106]|uniref:amidohydrolase family protein n=1 Tax=Pseudoduganella sp. UC29_106 TaxID=3374553 RepID=UPI0037581F0E